MSMTLFAAAGGNPKPEGRTAPMLVNEIARLFATKMRGFDLEGVMTQDSARLIMRTLAHRDGCSQLDLVNETHLKAPTVSVTLKRMEAEGLVRREANRMDLRVTQVFLTEQGIAHNRAVCKRLRELDEILMRDFSEEEKTVLRGYLERMRDNILSEM